jgi:hypothetical protein
MGYVSSRIFCLCTHTDTPNADARRTYCTPARAVLVRHGAIPGDHPAQRGPTAGPEDVEARRPARISSLRCVFAGASPPRSQLPSPVRSPRSSCRVVYPGARSCASSRRPSTGGGCSRSPRLAVVLLGRVHYRNVNVVTWKSHLII